MADTRLADFVREALKSGASKAEIGPVLEQAGWSKEQIDSALAEFSTVDFTIPVPTPNAHFSARDAFLYLIMFSMLYLSSYHLGSLLFQFVNLGFPDPALSENQLYISRQIRFSTSALLVAFPVFLFVAMRISKQITRDPMQLLSAVRKWLTYLTLAAAACIIVGDLIYLLNSLLSGELTVRFVLKALIVGTISGAIFAYYLLEMHKGNEVLET